MSRKTEWDFFDYFRSFKSALSMEKLFFSFSGLFLAGLIYGLMAFLGNLFDPQTDPRAQAFLSGLGIVLALITLLMTGAGIAKMLVSEELDDEELFFGEAVDFVKKTWLRVFAVPVMLVLIIGVLIGIKALFDLLVWVPVIGPLLLAVLYGFEFGGMFFLIILVIVSILSLFIYFPILSTTKSIGEAVKETLSTTFSRLPKLIVYLVGAFIFTVIIGSICMFIFAKTYRLNESYFLTTWDQSTPENQQYWIRTKKAAFEFAKPAARIMKRSYRCNEQKGCLMLWAHPGKYMVERDLGRQEHGYWYSFLGIILAAWMLVLLSITFAYPLSLWFSFGAMAYLTCRPPMEDEEEDFESEVDTAEETSTESEETSSEEEKSESSEEDNESKEDEEDQS